MTYRRIHPEKLIADPGQLGMDLVFTREENTVFGTLREISGGHAFLEDCISFGTPNASDGSHNSPLVLHYFRGMVGSARSMDEGKLPHGLTKHPLLSLPINDGYRILREL